MQVELVFTPNYVLAHKLISEATFWHQRSRLIKAEGWADRIVLYGDDLAVVFGANTLNLTRLIHRIQARVNVVMELLPDEPWKSPKFDSRAIKSLFMAATTDSIAGSNGEYYLNFPIKKGYFVFGTTWIHVPTMVQMVLKHFKHDQFLDPRFWR